MTRPVNIIEQLGTGVNDLEAHRNGSRVASSYGNATLKLELVHSMTSDFEKEPLHQKNAAAKKLLFFSQKKPPAAIFQAAYSISRRRWPKEELLCLVCLILELYAKTKYSN
jgi:hypothetical protein